MEIKLISQSKCIAADKTKLLPTVEVDFLVAEMSPESDRVAVV